MTCLINIFNNQYLRKEIFQWVEEFSRIDSHGNNFKYNEIPSVQWVIHNRHFNLLKEMTRDGVLKVCTTKHITLSSISVICRCEWIDIDTFKVLYHHFQASMFDEHSVVDESVASGQMERIEFLLDQKVPFTNLSFENAAIGGHLEILKLLLKVKPDDITNTAYDLAAKYGHLEILKYLDTIGVDVTCHAVNNALAKGHMHVVRYLFDRHMEAGYTMQTFRGIAMTGDLEVLEILVNDNLKHYGPLSTIDTGDQWPKEVLWLACLEHLEMVKWILENYKVDRIGASVVNLAIKKGDGDFAIYLIEKFNIEEIEEAVWIACTIGRLDLIQRLYNKLPNTTYSTKSVGAALEHGHDHIARFFVTQPLGLVVSGHDVFDLAVGHGNLEFLKFLIEIEYNGKVTEQGIQKGLTNPDNMTIIRYVLEECPEDYKSNDLVSAGALRIACYQDDLQLAKYLVQYNPSILPDNFCFSYACSNGSIEHLEFLLGLVDPSTHLEYLPSLVSGALYVRGHFHMLKYLYSRFQPIQPDFCAMESLFNSGRVDIIDYLLYCFPLMEITPEYYSMVLESPLEIKFFQCIYKHRPSTENYQDEEIQVAILIIGGIQLYQKIFGDHSVPSNDIISKMIDRGDYRIVQHLDRSQDFKRYLYNSLVNLRSAHLPTHTYIISILLEEYPSIHAQLLRYTIETMCHNGSFSLYKYLEPYYLGVQDGFRPMFILLSSQLTFLKRFIRHLESQHIYPRVFKNQIAGRIPSTINYLKSTKCEIYD